MVSATKVGQGVLIGLAAAIVIFTFVCWVYVVARTASLAKLCWGIAFYDGFVGVLYFLCLIGWAVYKFWPLRRTAKSESSMEMNDNTPINSGDVDTPRATDDLAAEADPELRRKRKIRACLRTTGFVVAVCFTGLVFLVIWAIFSLLLWVEIRTLPNQTGELNLPGLHYPVLIEREPDSGVVHITAQDDHDLYFAQGVATAQERLWQMEFQRLVVTGTLSSKVGSNAIDVDKLMRTLGVHMVAQETMAMLTSEQLAPVAAFVEGVNAYLDDDPKYPLEFMLLSYKPAKFDVASSISLGKLQSLTLSLNVEYELLRYNWLTVHNVSESRIFELHPYFDDQNFPIALSDADVSPVLNGNPPQLLSMDHEPRFSSQSTSTLYTIDQNIPTNVHNEPIFEWLKEQRAKGTLSEPKTKEAQHFTWMMNTFREVFGNHRASNNWVVGGAHTSTGKPILCNDPHLQITTPSVWMLFHLKAPGINVVGSSFPGAPGVVLGRNEKIAWGVTNTGADVQDLYIMNDNQTHYFHNGTWRPYVIRDEVIEVSGGNDVILRVRQSVYGPVITGIQAIASDYEGTTSLSLRWISLDKEDYPFPALQKVNRAGNWSEFCAAFHNTGFVGPIQNWVYADVEGNIGYAMPGNIPMRNSNHSGLFPVPGNGQFDWKGFIPFEKQVFVRNPAKGYIVTANNRITPYSWPVQYNVAYDWDDDSTGYRARRITEMIDNVIKSGGKLGIQTMAQIQMDEKSTLAKDFIDWVLPRIPNSMLTEDGAEWKSKLQAWNFDSSPGSKEATVWNMWYVELTRLPSAEIGTPHLEFPAYLLNVFNKTLSDPGCNGNCLQFAANALNQAVDKFAGKEWGKDIHRLNCAHHILNDTILGCLANRWADKGGDQHTVNMAGWNLTYANNEGASVILGPSYRQIVDLSNPDNSLFLGVPGQSGNQLSSEYDNFVHKFSVGEYVPMKINGYEVDRKLTLKPKN